MLERFKAYLDKDFSRLPRTIEVDDFYEELLGNLMEKAEACRKNGDMTEDEIFDKCVADVGDFRETLKTLDTGRKSTFLQLLKTIAIWTASWYLLTVLGYLITSFVSGGWSWSWLIIVAATAVWLVALDVYVTSICYRAKLYHFVRFGAVILGVLLDLCVFFIFAGITGAWNVAWLFTVLIPFIVVTTDIASVSFLLDKIYFLEILLAIFFFCLAAFLIFAQLLIGYQFAWLILLGGIVIDLLAVGFKLLYGKGKRGN